MLSVNDILTLANAGYTADQIEAMNADPNTGKQTDPNTGQQTDPNTGQQTDPNTGQQSDPEPNSTTEKILEELAAMRKAFEAGNVRGSNQPKQQNVDDILASIIAPKID